MVVDPNCRDLPVVWQFWRQLRIMEWEHSCLLVSDSRNLAGACSTSSFLFKGMVLSHETSTQNTQDSWRVWKILAIFASDLILAVKLKIRRSQQSRLLPPLRWGRFLMNGKAALQACWWMEEEDAAALVGVASPDFAAVGMLRIPRRIIIMVLVRSSAQDTVGCLKRQVYF